MESELSKASHKIFKIKYHFVICIKYRRNLFSEEKLANELKEICKSLEKRYFLKFETIGFDENHVHFMLQSVPKYSPSKVFRIVKSISAIRLFEKFPDLKKLLYGGEFWSDGGYVSTIGEGANADVIREYIKNQGRKAEQMRLYEFV